MLAQQLQQASHRCLFTESRSHRSTAHVKLAGGGIFEESLVEFGGVAVNRLLALCESPTCRFCKTKHT